MTPRLYKRVRRTVKNGTVVIDGIRYRPEERHMKYDGRCDGQRFWFGRYLNGGVFLPYVGLCTDGFGPDVVDGTLPWLFWHAVAE